MLDINHDYGEAWRRYEPGSLLTDTDEIVAYKTNTGEWWQNAYQRGIDSNFVDIINYALLRWSVKEENISRKGFFRIFFIFWYQFAEWNYLSYIARVVGVYLFFRVLLKRMIH